MPPFNHGFGDYHPGTSISRLFERIVMRLRTTRVKLAENTL